MRRVRLLTLVGVLALTLPFLPAVAQDLPPLPDPLPAPAGDVSVVRDGFGVPVITAGDEASLWFGAGYTAAQDRLWQADVLRRLGTGEQAALLGPDFVASDIEIRTVYGGRDRYSQLFADASVRVQTILSSYVEGMNAWIAEAATTGALPPEYLAQGLTPKPWVVEDVIGEMTVIGDNFGIRFPEQLNALGTLTELQGKLGPQAGAEVFADTHFLNDPSSPTTIDTASTSDPIGFATSPAGPVAAQTATTDLPALPDGPPFGEALRQAAERSGVIPPPASNAIVLGPEFSSDVSALLLGGPQMGHTAPQINHELALHGPDYDVTGMALPGVPLITIGVTDTHAWTLTTGGGPSADIFAEQLDPATPGHYIFDGESVPLECRTEQIEVAGGQPESAQVCESVHGPVIGQGEGVAFTLANPARGRELDSVEAWLDYAAADDVESFREAVSRNVYNFNVMYAGVDGDIAYFHSGLFPDRSQPLSFLPVPGDGSAEWEGFIDFADLPQVVNPEQGYIVQWNNKPAPGWQNNATGTFGFGPVHRVRALIDLVMGLEPGTADVATLEEFNRLAGLTAATDRDPQGSAGALLATNLLEGMVAEVDVAADPRLADVVTQLTQWDRLQADTDGDGTYDDGTATLFHRWVAEVEIAIMGDELGEAVEPDQVEQAWLVDPVTRSQILARLLEGDDAALPLAHDYLDGADLGQVLTDSLVAATDELIQEYGTADPTAWTEPADVLSWVPVGALQVPDTPWMNRGTYNQIVALGDGRVRAAENVIAPGQSGDPRSPHAADQLELYASWQYKPMALRQVDRLAGPDRITTAAAVALDAFGDGADTVVVARADDYADALAGAPLAARLDAPMLLANINGVPAATMGAIDALGATQAVVLGGGAALGPEVAAQLEDAGLSVSFTFGADRFETAAEVARRLGGDRFVVAEGADPDRDRGWPDALAAAAYAAAEQLPLLLVTTDEVPAATADLIESYNPAEILIIGGTVAVSEAVEEELGRSGAVVDRVAGATRVATAAALADRALAEGRTPDRLWLATSEAFPDALVAGPAVAATNGMLLLTNDTLDDEVVTAAQRIDPATATVLGGRAAVSADAASALVDALAGLGQTSSNS